MPLSSGVTYTSGGLSKPRAGMKLSPAQPRSDDWRCVTY